MWARYCAHIVLTFALIFAYFNGIGLFFLQMFLLIPPKPMVIHPFSIKKIIPKILNLRYPLFALCFSLRYLSFPRGQLVVCKFSIPKLTLLDFFANANVLQEMIGGELAIKWMQWSWPAALIRPFSSIPSKSWVIPPPTHPFHDLGV